MAMTLRLSEQDSQRLRERAEVDGTSMQDVATTAIRAYLDGRGRAEVVDDALADTLARYGTTLKRLGE
jgi:predicted transcriptional regulator